MVPTYYKLEIVSTLLLNQQKSYAELIIFLKKRLDLGNLKKYFDYFKVYISYNLKFLLAQTI